LQDRDRILRNGVGVLDCIGNTPLIRIKSLSEATGCTILAKAEFLNPSGSIKDRVALSIVQDAARSGSLKKGGLITEGTVGAKASVLAL
jgi:cysteine synthase